MFHQLIKYNPCPRQNWCHKISRCWLWGVLKLPQKTTFLSRKSADSWCKSVCFGAPRCWFCPPLIFLYFVAIQIFQVCKMGISPHDTTDLAADVVYILTSCTSCSLQKEVGPCFSASSTSVSQVHLHSTWEDAGVETGFVDEGGLCLVTRTGALN